MQRIATRNYPVTSQRVQLSESLYQLTLRWSQRGEVWHFDLADADGVTIIDGVPMPEGLPLLFRYRHLAVPPGELVLLDTKAEHTAPTLDDMGTRYQLLYLEPGEF